MSFFSNFGRTRGRRRSNLNLTVEFRTLSITAGDKDKSKGYNKDYRHVDYHQLTVDEIKTRFNSDLIHGLTENYTVAILEKSGKNVISPPPSNRFSKFIEYTFGGFGILLWISAIISFLAYQPLGGDHADPTNIGLGVLLLIVVLIQIGFNAYQDYCSSKIMDSIKDMLPASATVIRDGVSKVIPASDLVVGDLVQIKYGNKIPADLRITQSSDLKLDKSILSGESEAVKCTTETSSDNYLESKNIALMGTLATNGSGMGVVVQTGDQTVMGTLTKLSSQTKMSKTLLQKEIDRFVFIIASISITSSALVLLVWGVWLKVSYPTFLSLSGILVNVIGVLVAFTPAGLPVAVTLTLTLIARKMVANKVLVKNLNTVETLGSVDVLASDKTGTLTQNKMSVVNAITDRAYSSAEWDELYVGQDPRFIQLAAIASLCNGAQFDPSDLGLPIADRKVNGDATDTGILRFAESFKPNQVYLEEYRKLDEIPFNSKNKWMLSIYRPQAETNVFNSQDRILMIKGAPDILLPKCNYVLSSEGKETALTEELRNTIINEQMVASSQGQRVILLARAFLNDDKHADPTTEGFLETVHNLCVVGQVGIIDPPRDGIADVINTFKRAGIRTIMVTGDFALTAAAIARQIDILTAHSHDTLAKMRSINESEIQICIHSEKDPHSSKRALILAGSELNELTTLDWDKVCRYPEIVFARTTPEQKLKIVQEFQSRDHIVAVTGDGVNDSPALKNADVGIAMGGGSQVAIEAAHMVLLDSNFASILVAIENGRLVFDNLKKVILYLLPAGSFSEMIPILVNVILGSPIPLSPFFMIVICVLTDIFSSMAIMCEKPESNLLLRSPRRPKKDKLTDRNLLIHAYAFLGIQETMYAHIIYFTYMRLAGGFSPFQVLLTFSAWSEGYLNHTQEQLNEYAFTGQSIFFVSLVVMQAMGNLFSSRVRRVSTFKHNPFYGPGKNPYLFAAIISSLGIALIIIYVPFFNTVFNTRPIQVQYWFIPLGFAMIILLTEETRKYFARNYPNSIVGKLAW